MLQSGLQLTVLEGFFHGYNSSKIYPKLFNNSQYFQKGCILFSICQYACFLLNIHIIAVIFSATFDVCFLQPGDLGMG